MHILFDGFMFGITSDHCFNATVDHVLNWKKMLIVFQIFSESRIVEYSVKEKAMSPKKQEVQNFFCNFFSLFFQGLVVDTDF